ncbi:MAG TPA: ATP synthase F0 subunit B [Acidimicrobiales bacterium]|nr:ATP synthase F0 subunit B [Acidimicrobiales bacterium]
MSDDPRPVRASDHQPPQSEQLLRRAADVIASARPMPLSTSVMVNRDEVLELLEEGINRLPDELRAARWLLKERDEYLASVRREGEEILDAARARAEAMVQRTEVVKAAEQRARQLVDQARADARAMRHEVEDYCDQRLASFEIVLERVGRTVSEGRARLQGSASAAGGPGLTGGPEPTDHDPAAPAAEQRPAAAPPVSPPAPAPVPDTEVGDAADRGGDADRDEPRTGPLFDQDLG